MKIENDPKPTQQLLDEYDQMETGRSKERKAKELLKLAEFTPRPLPGQRTGLISMALSSIVCQLSDFLNPTPPGAISAAEGQLQRLRTRKRFEDAGIIPKN